MGRDGCAYVFSNDLIQKAKRKLSGERVELEFIEGETVRLDAPMWDGHEAVVRDVNEIDATVLIQILGATRELKVKTGNLRKAC